MLAPWLVLLSFIINNDLYSAYSILPIDALNGKYWKTVEIKFTYWLSGRDELEINILV